MNHQTLLQSTKSIVLGLLIAVGISYVQAAWQGPTASPPNANAEAPLNVSSAGQSKAGGLILNTGGATNGLVVANGAVQFTSLTNCGALSTDSSGNLVCGSGGDSGPITLVNGVHTSDDCANLAGGGNTVSAGGGEYVCKVSGASCPSGWTKYQNWSTTQLRTCVGYREGGPGGCIPRQCTTAQHVFTNQATETCVYYNIVWTGEGSLNCPAPDSLTCTASVTEAGCY